VELGWNLISRSLLGFSFQSGRASAPCVSVKVNSTGQCLPVRATNPLRKLRFDARETGTPKCLIVWEYNMSAMLANLSAVLQNLHGPELPV
jgi:hypothetical protein